MKLHLGCWKRHIRGFIHIDLCDMPHIDFKSSIDHLPFISDSSVELIYCSHALEYFDRFEAKRVLSEWLRTLAPGGEIRLAVPNFSALVELYRISGSVDKILGPMFGRMEINADAANPTVIYHKTAYDEKSLRETLLDAGFIDPCLWDWRLTDHANVDDHSQAYFPHMLKEGGLHLSLNMAAFKPK